MRMTTFYLIRHGEKRPNSGDPSLTDTGRAQAKKTGEFLSRLPISAVYCSPLLRAQETAEIIGTACNVRTQVEDRLSERMNWNDARQSFAAFLEEWNKSTDNPDYVPKGGKSVHQTATLLEEFMREVAEPGNDYHIVAVTHGGTIRDFLTLLSPEHKQILGTRLMEGIHECSISKIGFDGQTFSVQSFDDISHLVS